MSAADDLRDSVPKERAARAAPSTTKYQAIDRLFEQLLGLPAGSVYSASVSKPGNLKVRFLQSNRAASSPVWVAVVEEAVEHLDGCVQAAQPLIGPTHPSACVLVGEAASGDDWQVLAVVEPMGGPIGGRLRYHWPALQTFPATRQAGGGPLPPVTVPISLDQRTIRMARLAVAASPAVLLVGPPGTGKNRLLQHILDEIAAGPGDYGFTKAHEAVIEPADESWTTRDLVGGETVDENGQLRFRPGRVLDAVANDKWLVIDEANRADLDRIFGGLLTWLSHQQVIVGRASTKVDAPVVRLGWSETPESTAVGVDRLSKDDPGSEPIDYLAGTEFRLLGTYNALDATRVFRFGLALGRRFAHVPVPPASPDAFQDILKSASAPLPEGTEDYVIARMAAVYAAHQATPGAQIGPGLLIGTTDYVAKGLELAELARIDPGDDSHLDRLIAEAYLIAAGAWVARFDETVLAQLGQRLTTDGSGSTPGLPAGLTEADWMWVVGQLPWVGG